MKELQGVNVEDFSFSLSDRILSNSSNLVVIRVWFFFYLISFVVYQSNQIYRCLIKKSDHVISTSLSWKLCWCGSKPCNRILNTKIQGSCCSIQILQFQSAKNFQDMLTLYFTGPMVPKRFVFLVELLCLAWMMSHNFFLCILSFQALEAYESFEIDPCH